MTACAGACAAGSVNCLGGRAGVVIVVRRVRNIVEGGGGVGAEGDVGTVPCGIGAMVVLVVREEGCGW